ncbi:hypothetical protein LINPERHAP1_LOCUS28211, partial [Linum perenne]
KTLKPNRPTEYVWVTTAELFRRAHTFDLHLSLLLGLFLDIPSSLLHRNYQMNTSQLVDKQIMDLTSSSSPSSISQPQPLSPKSDSTGGAKDFINLMNHPKDDDHQHANYGAGTGDNGIPKEEILPSYDFHLIRPVVGGDSTTAGARSWNSADAKSGSFAMGGSPVRNYGSLDSIEPSKDVLEKDRSISDSAILSEIDKTMKRHTDNMLIVLEGVSSRLIQMESRTRHLESSVDDLKVSVGNNHGSADGKMRQLENILREVQTGVQAVKDKQELLEAQLQLSKLQVSKADQQQPEAQNAFQQQAASASAPPQAHQQQHPPMTYPQSIPSVPVPHPTVPSPQQQSYQPITSHPNQFAPVAPSPPSISQRDPYYAPAAPQTQEPPNPQYQVSPSQQQPQPSPAAPPHQLYQPIPQSAYPQQSQLQQPPPPASHHSEEASYLASQSYPPNLRHPTSQPPNGPLSPQQYYGYSPPSGPVEPPYLYGGSASQYGGTSTMKPQQLPSGSMSHSSGSGYPQLPTARMLPQASPNSRPAAGGGGSGSSSANRVPVDDVIDKVATMGFPREQVHEAVRKLTENGQSVDLNVVLDKLMNGGGYYGR